MQQSRPSTQTVAKADGFAIHPCDGFVTSSIVNPDDITYQFSFWIHDVTPDSEDRSKEYADASRFNIPLTTLLRTAVRMNPNLAWTLAMNILANLARIPDNIKQRHGIPQFSFEHKDVP